MHKLTEKIVSIIPVQGCDHDKLDTAVTEWCKDRLKWLESGDTSLKRIRRAFFEEQKIVSNKAYCKRCKTEIESVHRHDFVSCQCGSIAVDGGKDYLRRSYKDKDDYEDRTVYA